MVYFVPYHVEWAGQSRVGNGFRGWNNLAIYKGKMVLTIEDKHESIGSWCDIVRDVSNGESVHTMGANVINPREEVGERDEVELEEAVISKIAHLS